MEMKTLSESEVGFILDYLEERFGFPKNIFSGYIFIESSKRRVYIAPKQLLPHLKSLRVSTLGNLFCRLDNTIKPSTNMIQLFGKHATKNIIELDSVQVKQAVEGFPLETKSNLEGYVILKYKDFFLGCGLCKGGEIKNMIPKAKRIRLELF